MTVGLHCRYVQISNSSLQIHALSSLPMLRVSVNELLQRKLGYRKTQVLKKKKKKATLSF